jgi:hypothetical protein
MDKDNKSNNNNSKKERCYYCNKKLKIIHFTCKCNHKFCILHQNPHSHKCSFNNKKICQDNIKKNNPQTIHQKVVKI